ncbi:hypothetical protein ES706_05287 [subsurface metagenome]|jgi:uncharacterized protein YjbI with pentapeptide repeats
MTEEKQKPLTREDVLRLIEENGGTTVGLNLSAKVFDERVDLHGLDLKGIILLGSHLWGAHLEGADLLDAHLEGANLLGAHLEGADLWDAHLEGTELSGAHLAGADLTDAHLAGADLTDAHLEGANLSGANFSSDTNLRNVDWGNYILKDEKEENFAAAAVTYRQLKMWHTNAGMYDTAALFYYREMEAKRKALSWKKEPHLKLWGWIMRLLCGYGEKPYRVVASAATIIFGLAAAYHLWGSFNTSSSLDTLYYSAVSFTALGYGRWAPQPEGWAKGMGAAEAIIGVFMMALFLITFVRKMTR